MTDIIQLFDILRNLAERKSELDKQYFEQFIQPAWTIFTNIHEDYKKSFQDYIDFVSSDRYEAQTLIERIRRDSINTADRRTELTMIVQFLPSARLKTKEAYLSQFAIATIRYFHVPQDIRISEQHGVGNSIYYEDWEHTPNVGRFWVTHSLSTNETFDKEYSRKQAKRTLDLVLKVMQARYEKVAKAYYQLRTALLS